MKLFSITLWALVVACFTASAQNTDVRWDQHSLIINGKRVVPVMGEIHYSRIPDTEWAQ